MDLVESCSCSLFRFVPLLAQSWEWCSSSHANLELVIMQKAYFMKSLACSRRFSYRICYFFFRSCFVVFYFFLWSQLIYCLVLFVCFDVQLSCFVLISKSITLLILLFKLVKWLGSHVICFQQVFKVLTSPA